MFVTEAIIRCCSLEWSIYCRKQDDFCQQIKAILSEIADNLANYYYLFHSIRWNRSRKKIKEDLEQKLLKLAKQIHVKINTVGSSLNQYAEQKPIGDIKQFNQIIQLLQEARMLVEIHHLNGEVSHVPAAHKNIIVPGTIPGLEGY